MSIISPNRDVSSMIPLSSAGSEPAEGMTTSGSMGKRVVIPIKEILTDWQQCKQLFKVVGSIVLTLGVGLLFPTFRHTIQQWWNDIKTGERTIEQWPTSSLPSDAESTHQVGQKSIGKGEEIVVLEGKLKNGKLDGPGKIFTPDGSVWQGQFVDGVLQGQGKKTWPDGIITEGEFINGLLQGKAKITYPSKVHNKEYSTEGMFKDGELVESISQPDSSEEKNLYKKKKNLTIDTKIEKDEAELEHLFPIEEEELEEDATLEKDHSKGKLKLPDYFNIVTDGHGEQTLPNGVILNGLFKAGFLVKGTITHPDKTVEEGNFKFDALHGVGKKTLPNGDILEGEFVEGQLKKGKKIIAANNMVFEGTFVGGQFQNGIKLHSDGTQEIGTFSADLLEEGTMIVDGMTLKGKFNYGILTEGEITYPDGKTEKGIFQYGQLNGSNCTKTLPDGTIMQGKFEDGELNGHGTKTLPNGDVLEGHFTYGKLYGPGTLTHPNGEKIEGEFKEDVLQIPSS